MRIPIRLAGEPGVRYGREPLTFGVPFAEGAFPAGTALRCVTADGRELPLQTAVMTTWKKDLRDVKWLLADIQADPARDGEAVWLESAAIQSNESNHSIESIPAIRSTSSTPAIATTHAAGQLTLDTGALRLKLRTGFERWKHRECDSPVAGCEIKTVDGAWRETLHGPGLLLYMRDQHGNLYTSLGACPQPRVTLEEQGPLRVCVLITGHLMSAQGVRFCPYRLRIHLYAGKADLRIFHTFIFDQDPTRVELKAIGMKVFAKTGDEAVGAVGGSESLSVTLSRALSVPEFDKARDKEGGSLSLLQLDDMHYTATRDGQPAGSGAKAPGWAALGGANAGVVAAVRDFWQEYPKGFGIERDSLDVRVWPEDAPQPLSFLTPFDEPPINFHGTRDEAEVKRLLAAQPTAPLALVTFGIRGVDDIRWIENVMARLAPGRVMSYSDFLGQSTGIGAAKTTELALRFTAGPVASDEAAAFARTVQEPLAGIVDPDYLCGTDVFERFLPAGHPLFADLDRDLDVLFEQGLVEPIERCRRYGMMMFGQMVNVHTPPGPDAVYQLYKDTEPEKALRYVGPFNNEASDMVLSTWGQFLRTGERRHLRWAQRASHAVADVSFVHACPGHEENVGCLHYHGPHVWANALNRAHSEVGFMMADYYLTGNRRMLEVALEVADGLLRDKIEPCGVVNVFTAWSREFTGPLSVLMEAYQLTWHEKYGDPAQRSLNWLLRATRTPGHFPRILYTRGPRGAEAVVDGGEALEPASNPYHFLDPALRLFPSKPLKDFIMAQAAYGHSMGRVQAYDMTGDPGYAAALYDALVECRSEIADGKLPGLYWVAWCDSLPRQMKTVALAAAQDAGGFLEYARKWREERQARPPVPPPPPPPVQKGEISLGVLSTEPFANPALTSPSAGGNVRPCI